MGPTARYALSSRALPSSRWSGRSSAPRSARATAKCRRGSYSITPGQMNLNSRLLSCPSTSAIPNAYERAYGPWRRLHNGDGACSSAGCLSMTAKVEILRHSGVHTSTMASARSRCSPTRSRWSAANLAKHRLDPNIGFCKQLKEGSDHFEVPPARSRRWEFAIGALTSSTPSPANGQPSRPRGGVPLAQAAMREIEAQVAR